MGRALVASLSSRSRRPRPLLPTRFYLLHPWSRASRDTSTSMCVADIEEKLDETLAWHARVVDQRRDLRGRGHRGGQLQHLRPRLERLALAREAEHRFGVGSGEGGALGHGGSLSFQLLSGGVGRRGGRPAG